MRLTKDEARILSDALAGYKYDIAEHTNRDLFDKLQKLEDKLDVFSKDQRRTGRTSMDDFQDCLKRFCKKD